MSKQRRVAKVLRSEAEAGTIATKTIASINYTIPHPFIFLTSWKTESRKTCSFSVHWKKH